MPSCGFGDLDGFLRDAARAWLGIDPAGVPASDLLAQLAPVLAFDWLLARLGAPTSGAAVVGKLGGPICAEGAAGGTCLLVPTASLREPTLVRADLARDAPPLPPGLIAAGPPIEIVPHVTLERPAPLFLPVDSLLVSRALVRPDRVRAFHHEGAGGAWEEIPMSMPHTGPPHVRAVVSEFSYFQAAVLDDAPAVGLEHVAALSGQPMLGAYLFDRGESAVTTGAINDEGRVVGEIVRITPDAGGQLVTTTIVPEICDLDIDGPKRGLAVVGAGLYFTVQRPVTPPEYRLVRWDLSAPDGACAARPFEVLWSSGAGGGAIGGMAYRSSGAGGELYLASASQLQLLGRAPIVAHTIVRIPLEATGDCRRDAIGECAVERVAGGCLPGFNGERGPAQDMLLRIPLDVAVGPLTMAGGGDVVLVADAGNHRVRAINVGAAPVELSGKTIQPGELVTIAGSADCHGTSAAALAACDPTIVDPGDPCAGVLCSRTSTTPVRDGLPLSQVDLVGPSSIIASKTGLLDPDPTKNGLVIAESCRHQILFADLPLDGSEGLLRPIAGTADSPGDVAGPYTGFDLVASAAVPALLGQMNGPADVWTGEAREIFVADANNHAVKRIRFHDVDGDAIGDGSDNCPNVASDDLLDVDHDGLGNPCDPDADDDGKPNAEDNCPLVANLDQLDRDGDGVGDVCTLPDLIEGLEDVLKNTSAVVEGHVTGVAYTYDEREGPRTNVTLAVDRVHLGSYAASSVELHYLGGPVPDRGFLEPSEQPRFARSGRYLVFLRNTAWFLGPTVFGYVLRIEEAFGREVLIDETGCAVWGLDGEGPVFMRPRLFTPMTDGDDAPALPRLEASALPALAGGALSATDLVARVQAFAVERSLAIGGGFTPNPDPTRHWRIWPAAPDDSEDDPRAPPRPPCSDDAPVCTNDVTWCSGAGSIGEGCDEAP